jgi:phosphatidylglycerophosphatase A
MKTIARPIATFFGAGRYPFAPGTFASFLAVWIYKFFVSRWPWPWQIGTIAILFFVGVWAAGLLAAQLGQKDPRSVVIDEVCGQWVAFLFVPSSWAFLAAGFFLFRLFDVIKPFPIRRLERLPGGWGIMADDILAGIYASALLQLYIVLA